MSLIRLLHRVYKCTLSPLLIFIGGPGAGCRFEPSCSDYALGAVEAHGWGRGAWLALRRMARCQPWGGAGYDPVPPVVSLGARPPHRGAPSASPDREIFPHMELDVPAPR